MIAGNAAAQAEAAYVHALRVTEKGRESQALCDQAEALGSAGADDAYPLLLKAVDLFADEDESSAANAARFEFARCLMERSSDSPVLDLGRARSLLERVVASSAHRRVPARRARDLDTLAQVYRRLAAIAPQESISGLLRAALIYSHAACEAIKEAGTFGWCEAAGYLHNQGNILRQMGRDSEALRSERQAGRFLNGALNEDGRLVQIPIEPRLRFLISLHIAEGLLARGHGHLREAREMAQRAHALEPVDMVEATLLLSEILHQSGAESEASDVVSHRDSRSLALRDAFRLAAQIHRLGNHGRALEVLAVARHNGHLQRHDALSDRSADRVACEMQAGARLEALIHSEQGQHIEAFLALEATSGLRFVDSLGRYTSAPRDAVERELAKIKLDTDNAATSLDRLAETLRMYPDLGSIREVLDDAFQLRTNPSHEDPVLEPSLLGHALVAAATSDAPLEELRKHIGNALQTGRRALAALVKRNPDMGPQAHSLELSPDGLATLAAENADALFVRVTLDDDLFAAAAWWDGNQLQGVSTTIPTSGAARAIIDETPSSAIAIAENLNLGPLFSLVGSALPTRIVILPSAQASVVPWAATRVGERLLIDIFDSIEQLPSLYPHQVRQAARHERAGTVLISPGAAGYDPTHFHQVAFQARSRDAELFDADATIAKSLELATSADVVAFYAHGVHHTNDEHAVELTGDTDEDAHLEHEDERGGVELVDGRLIPLVDGDHWVGCERVELWACESGVNRSTDWLSPMVDEGFGVDNEFLRQGVRSAIGTLWPVKEISTAFIAREFGRHVDDGVRAPAALVLAQRAWRSGAVPKLDRLLRVTPAEQLEQTIRRELALPAAGEILQNLGPVGSTNETLSGETVDNLMSEFASPEAWAGFRFIGVCERRPTGPPLPADSPPLTEEEAAEVRAILEREIQPEMDWDDWVDMEIDRRCEVALTANEQCPVVEQAVEIARHYAVRRRDRTEHNLLRGLAWLGEALAAPERTQADRDLLQTEAGWLWCELLRGELADERLRPLEAQSTPGYLSRFTTSLAVTDGPDAAVLRGWHERLTSPHQPPAERPPYYAAVVSAIAQPPESLIDWRRLAAGGVLLTPWMNPDLRNTLKSHL